MPRNGSGSYSLPTNSWNPAVSGVLATTTDYQSLINDVASALTQSVSKDGQTVMTGSLNMGGFNLTNVASAAIAALTGTPTAPTAAPGTNTTQIATTAFVAASFAPINSPTFTGTVTIPGGASISGYATLVSPAFTGTPTAPTAVAGDNTTQIATTAHVFAERTNTATLTNKTLTSPVINSPTGIVKGDVGLGNVDNTSDAAKPVSTATQTALNLKQDLDADLTAIAGLATTGLIARTGAGTVATRTLTAGAGVSITNGDGVSGNPTISVTGGSGTGDVIGPASSTDNAIARFDSTTGKLLQNSTVTVSDAGDVAGLTGINGGQVAGFRNKIINGEMQISQRGTTFAAIASGDYCLDRYRWGNNASPVVTISQQTDAPSDNEFQNSLRVAVTTADASISTTDFSVVGQIIEGYQVRDLIGRTFTLSFWARSSKTGVHCVAFRNTGGNRSYITEYTINAADTWEKKSVVVSGGLITAGTWDWTTGRGLLVDWVLACGATFQTTKDAWQTGDFLATSSQVNCLDTIGNIFAITGVQLEVGAVATPFEHRPYGTELRLCQRYLPAFVMEANTDPIGPAWCPSTTEAQCEIGLPETTRIAPTGITVSAASGFKVFSSAGVGIACTTLTFGAASRNSIRIAATVASGLTAGQASALASNSAGASILVTGCEL